MREGNYNKGNTCEVCGVRVNNGCKRCNSHKATEETRRKQSLAKIGKPSWNKGKKWSEESKKKLSQSRKGLKPSQETREKLRLVRIGYKHSEETKRKIAKAHRGKIVSESARINMSKATKYKPKYNQRGINHWNWKGGIKPLNETIRHSIEYRLWREAVFTRDDWTCRFCGQKGGKLVADHIKQFAFYPELRFAIDNGRTLCKECHKKTNTFLVNKKL